jgi:aerobic carbon-monoxide dehydrogenase large subunit
LTEHAYYEHGTGQLLTGSFMDYALPRADLVPTFTLTLTEDPTAGNPLRIKGAGEAGITPCLAAVVNAVVDALSPLGIRHLQMPVTSARVWSAIRGGSESASAGW